MTSTWNTGAWATETTRASMKSAGKTAALAAGALAMGLTAFAATGKAHHDLSVSTTWAFESEYIFRGVQFSETALQPDLNFTYGNFNLGAWASVPVGDDDVAFGDEIDIYGSYSFGLSETFSSSVGFTYYIFPDAASGFFDTLDEEDGTGANTFEINGSIAADVFLSPSVTLYYDFMFETVTLEGSIGNSFSLYDALSLDISGTLGHVFDDDEDSDYTYYMSNINLSYGFTEDVAGYVGVRYGRSSEDFYFDDVIEGTFQNNSIWFGFGLSAGF